VRVAFLTNIVSPYRKPVFERLARTPGWDFRVFVNAANERDRSWKVDLDGLNVVEPATISVPRRVRSCEPIPFAQVITMHLPVGLWGALRRFRPDVVISHELGPRTMVAASYTRFARTPLVIWSYQSRISATQGHRIRRSVRRRLLRCARSVVGMGRQAREVLEALEVPPDRIIDVPNAANEETFRRRLDDPASTERAAAIRRSVADGRRLALVVGRLVPLKGTASIIQAWCRVAPEIRRDWRLVFAGHGPLEPLVHEARSLGVVHAGDVPTEEVADWYRAADLHVFPSLGDVWGLVVNEAMACGTPTLCSIHAGCCDDLIDDGRTGLVFDPSAEDAHAALARAMTSKDLPSLGAAGRETVARCTLDRLAAAFRDSVDAAVSG
jgi:glycosyltransferase involved in cell wall biosynthesis